MGEDGAKEKRKSVDAFLLLSPSSFPPHTCRPFYTLRGVDGGVSDWRPERDSPKRGGWVCCRKTINWWFLRTANLFAGRAAACSVYTACAHNTTRQQMQTQCKTKVPRGRSGRVRLRIKRVRRRRRIALWPAYSLCDSLSPRTIIIYHRHAFSPYISIRARKHISTLLLLSRGLELVIILKFEGCQKRVDTPKIMD